jgi:hypothetical protein
MFFALGFLTAILIVIATLPAIRTRANRLARRNVEASLPLTLAEIDAERDLLLAESAVAENRKDQLISRKNEILHQRMLELSNSRTTIETLNASVKELKQELENQKAISLELRQQSGNGDYADISAQNAALSRRIEELADSIMAHASKD